MESGMPFLKPMGAEALQRGPHKAPEPLSPPAVPAAEEAILPPQPEPLWEPLTPEFPSAPEKEDEDWPDEGEDAVPTDSMPEPVCVPTYPFLETERPQRSWPIVLMGVGLGLAAGYAAYRLGWMKLLLQGLEQAAQCLQSLILP